MPETVISKQCGGCKQEKLACEFAKGNSRGGLASYCRACATECSRRWAQANPEKNRAKTNKWRATNSELVREKEAISRLENPEMHRAKAKRYADKNRPLLRDNKRIKHAEMPWINREMNARHRARGGVAPWSNREARLAIYEKAYRLTIETGIPHEVNHTVPLKSRYVSGLHCEANLEVITMSENRGLKNGEWPDMPEELLAKRRTKKKI